MKRLLSFILCLNLLITVGITAAAAPMVAADEPITKPGAAAAGTTDSAVNERLKAITLKVKNTLGIGDSFTSFSGTLSTSETAQLWSLNWSNDKEQINVSVNDNGRIVSYYDYIIGSNPPSYGRIPRLPSAGIDQAKTVAKAFLTKVLDTKIESVELSGNSSLDYSGSAVCYLNGIMKLNGIDTPINISLNVRTDLNKVTSFYRSDAGQDYSGVTKPTEAKDQAAAAAALKGTLNMTMSYVLPGDGSHTAILQYQPKPDGTYVVDATSGKLVDLSKLDYGVGRPVEDKAASPAFTTQAASGSAAVITAVEQSAIDKMQGLMSQSALEEKVRSYTELGLTGDFKLTSVSYYTYEDDSKQTRVTANMSFASAPKDAASQYRYIGIDAKSGKLLSVSSDRIYMDSVKTASSAVYSAAQTETTARSFAGKVMPEEFKATKLTNAAPSATDSVHSYSFTRVSSDIPFPENYINIGVDPQTGYVVSYWSNWYTYSVTFPSPAGAITVAAATDKYAAGTGTALKYVSVPASVQPSGLLLSYTSANTNVYGVNALTGELLQAAASVNTGLSYNDIDSSPYASIIKQLASFGVGFPGSSFKPDAQLTQEDALLLIESTNGSKVMPLSVPGSTDDLYNMAYTMGILTPEEKNPAKPVSRAEYVKYLINALGYGDVAKLPGIYKTGFSDEGKIPQDLLGYVAISKGLGIIRGDQNGQFKPNDTATRAQAAVMLYNCMTRK